MTSQTQRTECDAGWRRDGPIPDRSALCATGRNDAAGGGQCHAHHLWRCIRRPVHRPRLHGAQAGRGQAPPVVPAVEQSPASIVITDSAANIEYVNPKFIELHRLQPGGGSGQEPRILKSGETSPETYRELWRPSRRGRSGAANSITRRRTASTHWESASISPIRAPCGRITHIVAVKEDITARKWTEKALFPRTNMANTRREGIAGTVVNRLRGL